MTKAWYSSQSHLGGVEYLRNNKVLQHRSRCRVKSNYTNTVTQQKAGAKYRFKKGKEVT